MDKTDVKVLAELLKDNTTVTELHVNSNGLNADAGKLFLPIVDKPHFEIFDGIPIKQIRENTVTKLDLKGSKGKQLQAYGGIVLAHVLTGNTSVQGLDASKNAMGTAGAKVFGDMLLVNKTIQTLDVSNNSFGKMQVGDKVKIKSSGEMKIVTEIRDGNVKFSGCESLPDLTTGDYDFQRGYVKASAFDWESQVPAFCAGVAASPSLTSVSTSYFQTSTSCLYFSLLPCFLPCT